MAIDYGTIRADNERDWPKIAKIGPMLAGLYADRTHLLFELLQNAEDALRRRRSDGPRSVTFEIGEDSLRVRHYGEPFNEDDVRSICGIGESTKQEDKTAIGRFGIGFKSVYAWTDRPEIHSAGEHFAIETWVHPIPTAEIDSAPDETVIVIPFKDEMADSRGEIVKALQSDSGSALLFLREIGEIAWSADGESSGHYQREQKPLGDDVHLVTIVGQGQAGSTDVESSWLVFSEPVEDEGIPVGHVEIAFSYVAESADAPARIEPVSSSPLSAYFPTALETHLGFLMQGPYRTTPARDNVPPSDEWNVGLVAQTAALLKRTLPWLRDHDYLTPAGLECLPFDSIRFDAANMFAPLFQATKEALTSEPLLPAGSSTYVSARESVLGGTIALRKLFSAEQVTELLESSERLTWLDAQITRARTPSLHNYLRGVLDVHEVDGVGTIVRRLDRSFLEQQTDEWMRALYATLKDQTTIQRQEWFAAIPIVRLEDETHVQAHVGEAPAAYLPTSAETGYPTVRRTVCDTDDAREFLEELGLREPDPIDDVIDNVLPAYTEGAVPVDDDGRYVNDLQRLVSAYQTGSANRRQDLTRALRRTPFVKATDAETGEVTYVRPTTAYAPTKELRALFDGVLGVSFLDSSMRYLGDADAKTMLEACGISAGLRARRVVYDNNTPSDQWKKLANDVQLPYSTRGHRVEDWDLHGLSALLKALPNLNQERQSEVASMLWACLGDLAAHASNASFDGIDRYFYRTAQVGRFPAQFVRVLNAKHWVPTENGGLAKPEEVVFESLGWVSNSFLEERIQFKEIAAPPIVALAEQVDVDVGALALLKEHGVTRGDLEEMLEQRRDVEREAHTGSERQTPARTGGSLREFRSYVAVEPASESGDGSADQERKMALEDAAREHIRKIEPEWEQTELNNPGFDLYQTDADGEVVKWCEIKSLGGGWGEHPVGLSHTQFKLAQAKGDAYWLYVVEHAGDPERIRLLRIQDPAGLAETFTFDDGWAAIAEPDDGAG